MKIAINCIFFQPKGGGIKEYIYNLIQNISLLDKENTYILYVLEDQYSYARESLILNERMRLKTVPYKSHSFIEKIKRSLFERNFWKKEEEIEKFDLFHSPFFHSPIFKVAKVILTVHDLRFFRYPSTYTFSRYLFLRFAVKKSLRDATHIISISEFTKREIIEAFGISSEKITVIHEAINREYFIDTKAPSDEELDRLIDIKDARYLLSVGHIEPRKNYETLISCFLTLKEDIKYRDLKLVIVGKKGHNYSKVINLINESSDIFYLDFVSHELLCYLYKNAALFVFPSFYEGFGFPPLEAAAFGTVSAVSEISSMPEVCGDSVFYFNPFEKDNIVETLDNALSSFTLLTNKKELLANNLDRFSWDKNARETISLYNKI